MSNTVKKRSGRFFSSALIMTGDLIAIWLSVVLLSVWFGNLPFDMQGRTELLLATIAYIPVWLYLKPAKDINHKASLDKVLINSFKAVIIHALVFMSLAAFLNTEYTVKFYLIFYAILFLAFPLLHVSCRIVLRAMRKKGYFSTKVAIVGTNPTSTRLKEAMLKDSGSGYKVIGFFDDEIMPDFDGNVLGDFKELERYAQEGQIDEIYFTLVGEKAEKMNRVVNIANEYVVPFFYVPKITQYVKGVFELHNIGAMPVLTLGRNPLSLTWRRLLKRSFDVAFSGIVLLISPVFFIPIGIAIKVSSPGPILFRQQRTGYKGRSFTCYKFRTMRVNKDSDKVQATENDPRKTRIGDLLRRTNLDELPQFINVFKGDMSIVGPRPHMLKHTEYYSNLIEKYMVRHVVRPGITGWAQINGYRGVTDELWKMEKRVEHDVWYIENWSFPLDLRIVARTILNTIRGDKNAF